MDCACFILEDLSRGRMVSADSSTVGLAGEHDGQEDMPQALQADRVEVVVREVELEPVLEGPDPPLHLLPAEGGDEGDAAFQVTARVHCPGLLKNGLSWRPARSTHAAAYAVSAGRLSCLREKRRHVRQSPETGHYWAQNFLLPARVSDNVKP